MAIVATDTPSAEPARQTGMQRRHQRISFPQVFLAYNKEDKVIFGAFVMESCFHVRMDWIPRFSAVDTLRCFIRLQ